MIQKGMKVLFIAPKFFGYEQEIKAELERFGCEVDWFDDRPSSTPIVKALIRFRPELIASYSDAYFDRIIAQCKNTPYDVVFVIKGEALSKSRLDTLKASQKQARFLYYSWDSLKNFKNGLEKLSIFDKVYSFDRDDCINYSFVKHLPLFYTQAYEKIADENQVPTVDLLFLGSIHSDRYPVVQKIWTAAKAADGNVRLYDYFFYQSKWVFALRKIFDKQFRAIPWSAVKWRSLNEEQTLALVAQTNTVVDIHHPGQKGLTMRTIESLGAKKKLITTNHDVKRYDFYNPNNIHIVERNAPAIPVSFLSSNYQQLPTDLYRQYSLASWLKEIFI